MYSVCMNDDNKIIGINLSNNDNFINIFDINFSKQINEENMMQSIDSLGRKLYKEINKETGITTITSNISNTDLYNYEPIMIAYPKKVDYDFVSNIEKFSYKDIIDQKKKQLIDKYKCKDCILYEFIDEQDLFDCNTGKNTLIIDSETISNKIQLSDVNEIYIYIEGNVNVQVSNDQKNWIDITNFIDFKYKKLYIKLMSENIAKVYSLAILIR